METDKLNTGRIYIILQYRNKKSMTVKVKVLEKTRTTVILDNLDTKGFPVCIGEWRRGQWRMTHEKFEDIWKVIEEVKNITIHSGGSNAAIGFSKKPPSGLIPKRLHDEKRFNDLCLAIKKRWNAIPNLDIPVEWIQEYNLLALELQKPYSL